MFRKRIYLYTKIFAFSELELRVLTIGRMDSIIILQWAFDVKNVIECVYFIRADLSVIYIICE